MTPDEALLNELARRAIGAGYCAHGVPGDGNCQFHALLAALLGAVNDGIIDAIELERASVDGELSTTGSDGTSTSPRCARTSRTSRARSSGATRPR